LGDAPIDRLVSRPRTVQQDWLAWLPEEKGALFQAMFAELEVSYTILSIALDDALTFCNEGRLAMAREQARMFSGLFERVTGRMIGVLRSMDEHARQFGTAAKVAPLQVDMFRNDQAQSVARANYLLSMVSLRRPGRLFRKLAALNELVAKLQTQVRAIASEIVKGTSLSPAVQWANLEVLHHDANTCFCETSIVLKSFLCAMPDAELLPFRARLLSLAPTSSTIYPGRSTPFVTNIMPASQTRPQSEPNTSHAQSALVPDDDADDGTDDPSNAQLRRRQLNS
jgi:hypothetical protein